MTTSTDAKALIREAQAARVRAHLIRRLDQWRKSRLVLKKAA
jgi:hypothetical protein